MPLQASLHRRPVAERRSYLQLSSPDSDQTDGDPNPRANLHHSLWFPIENVVTIQPRLRLAFIGPCCNCCRAILLQPNDPQPRRVILQCNFIEVLSLELRSTLSCLQRVQTLPYKTFRHEYATSFMKKLTLR